MNFKRAVIKVGSALIAPDKTGCDGRYIIAIAQFIRQCHEQGKQVIIVSSGSVAAGRKHIQHGGNQLSIETKQAMAAVGQMNMMANWQRFFDLPCSQLLITHGDLKDRQRYINIKNTLRVLLENQIIPIVNENDTVATEELKVGDNDNLAALVAQVSDADSLFILSDIDGLFDEDPRINPQAKLIPEVEQITDAIYALAGTTRNPIATGGMKTKIQAAESATNKGINTFIVNGKQINTFNALLNQQNPGTWFKAQQGQKKAKKHWLKYTLKSAGSIVVDAGAKKAVLARGASLLPSGIVELTGQFAAGDCVELIHQGEQQAFAKGICQYNSQDLTKIKQHNSDEIAQVLGYCPSKVVIHRDDLVLLTAE